MAKGKWHSLKDTPLPGLLHTISLRQDPASVLDITRGMLKRKIYFKKGWPVNVVSNSLSDVFGRLLLEEGVISQETYEKTLEIMQKEKKKCGEVLISMGLVSQKELYDYLILQLKKKIWKIFDWPDGNYNYFLIKGAMMADIQLLPQNPASIIIYGILNGHYPFERIETELGRFMDKPLVVSQNKPYNIEDLGFNIQQSRFLAKFDGAGKAKEVIKNSDLLHREATLLTYALLITAIISPKGESADVKEASEALKYEPQEEHGEEGIREEKCEAKEKVDAELIFQSGKMHLAEKDYEKAVTEFEEIVRLNPNEGEYKAYLGWALFNNKYENIEMARNFLLEALLMNPDMDIAYLFLARLYIKEGLLKEAENALIKALEKNPFLSEARKELTLIKMRSVSDVLKKGYVDYFHLTRNPFDLLPDPTFLYTGNAHSEALYFLVNGIKNGRSNITLLMGDKGSGKTTLCLKIMDKLADEKIVFIYIDSPLQSWLEILIAVKNELGIKTTADSAEEVLSALYTHFSKYSAMKGRTIIILDEAHKLSINALMAVKRLLDSGVDNMVISGQPEIEGILHTSELKDIKQSITGAHQIHSLSLEETKEYILKRLEWAGSDGTLHITPWAIRTVHSASSGNPELINKICDNVFDLAKGKETRIIDEQIVKVIEEAMSKELYARLPQLEPVEERVEELFEEKIKKSIDEQIGRTVDDAIKREFDKRVVQFDTAVMLDEMAEKVKRFVNEQINNIAGDVVKNELDRRAAQLDIHAVLNEAAEKTGKLVNEQIINTVRDAVRDEVEGRITQRAAATASNEVLEKGEKPFEMKAEPMTDRQMEKTIDNGFGQDMPQFNNTFVSFEAEKKQRFFEKGGSLLKILMLAIAAAALLGVIINYNIVQELGLFSTSHVAQTRQSKPVNLPTVKQPATETAPITAQPAPEAKAVLPEAAIEALPQGHEAVQPELKDTSGAHKLLSLTFEINKRKKETVSDGNILKVKKGDKIKILSVDAGDISSKDITVNLLGFIGDKNKNIGEDRGYPIDTAKDLWAKYSIDGKGREYPIVIKRNGEKIGSVLLKISE